MSKYAIFGDIHGNLEALDAVLTDAYDQKVNHYDCLGDIVGYNANPRECIERIQALQKAYPDCRICRGNHDYVSITQLPLNDMNSMAKAALKWTRTQLTDEDRHWLRYNTILSETKLPFALVHASLDAPALWNYIFSPDQSIETFNKLNELNIPLCFCGHTHVPNIITYDETTGQTYQIIIKDTITEQGIAPSQINVDATTGISTHIFTLEPQKKYIINPGSVGQARDSDPRASYVIYDDITNTVTYRRLPYNIESAQYKIHQIEDLPDTLADRLSLGR